jgi:hypothetical protein
MAAKFQSKKTKYFFELINKESFKVVIIAFIIEHFQWTVMGLQNI